jgi:YD repeat-containing protein
MKSTEYDPNGNVTKETDRARDRSTSFTYDKDDKLKTETETGGITTEYTYDKNGNTTQRKHTAGGITLTQGFVYNAMDELTRVTENGQSVSGLPMDEADRNASRKNR